MLTPRQAEIAEYVARGYSAKKIARRTGLAMQTVKDHIHNAGQRLPGDGPPRFKIIVFVLRNEEAA